MFLFLFYTEGFIVLAIESFWTRLFSQYFVCSEDETRDDLLFYVRGKSSNKDGKVDKDHQEVRSGSCYQKESGYNAVVQNQGHIFDPLTPMSDQDRISPHNINTISNR